MGRHSPPPSEITPEASYLRRRELIRNGAIFAGATTLFGGAITLLTGAGNGGQTSSDTAPLPSATNVVKPEAYRAREELTPYDAVTHYNNFYEFGLGKAEPAENAHTLRPRPWTLEVGGLVEKPLTLDLDTILRWFSLEERVYRMRCVEAWSMVIPWLGFPLGALISKLRPTSAAKYVAFQTLLDENQMPLQAERVLDWPYVEGLRIDEATHPLALLAVGLYGKLLPNQNGAPLRLVVPWKYGFKGIKSIVKIWFTETRPRTTWSSQAASAYGFYANVNPNVDHPRWSQATERRVGELARRPTLLFNGYADEVASLYRSMDLAREF